MVGLKEKNKEDRNPNVKKRSSILSKNNKNDKNSTCSFKSLIAKRKKTKINSYLKLQKNGRKKYSGWLNRGKEWAF